MKGGNLKMQKISRTQLTKKYNITRGQWQNRHDDLLEHLNDYFSIQEIKEGRYYYYIVPDEIPDEVPILPHKSNKKEKETDYGEYVKENLSEEFEPNSKMRMSRKAIHAFGKEKYHHTSAEGVAKRYVGPAMEKYGEHSHYKVWVDPNTYIQLTEEEEEYRRECFVRNHLTDKKLQEIGSESLEGIEPSQEDKDYYQKAMELFVMKYGFRPILVYSWRAKKENKDNFEIS